ncbi:lymphocyte antigen 86 isoform X1 [Bufo gargarizans]|uniref:lymphocyte antigen 86 isoform X1 n=1 Tax=Bufo gargarizans TaxID=30331 RepID=UPI001CF14C26|nr:lymphocyte antigen 86 isoform X1 [Bufo gargarizans]
MKNVAIVLTISWLLRPGEMKEWPTHTICKTKDFEAYYKSCDPLQDIGVSFYPCSRVLTKHITAKIGVILRQDINLLHMSSNFFYNGAYLFHEDKYLCDYTAPKFSFCGKKKGEFVLYNHFVSFGFSTLPKGEYFIMLELLNEHAYKVACANFTLYSHSPV